MSHAPREPADGFQELPGLLLALAFLDRLADAPVHVVFEDQQGGRLQPGPCGRDLIEHIDTVPAVLLHLADAGDLPFDAAEPPQDAVVVGSHGRLFDPILAGLDCRTPVGHSLVAEEALDMGRRTCSGRDERPTGAQFLVGFAAQPCWAKKLNRERDRCYSLAGVVVAPVRPRYGAVDPDRIGDMRAR